MNDIPNAEAECRSSLMLFEPACYGHHAYFLRLLAEEWLRSSVAGRMDIVVSPDFVRVHADFAAFCRRQNPERLTLVPFSQSEHEALRAGQTSKTMSIASFLSGEFDPNERSSRSWALFCGYAKRLQASHAMLMFLDNVYFQVAAHADVPCSFSGILFRPTFHLPVDESIPAEALQRLQEKFTLARALKHPRLARLFCLDATAVAGFGSEHDGKLVAVSDPVAIPKPGRETDPALRSALGIEGHRKVMLFFGELSPRKGLSQLLSSLLLLSGEVGRQLCLLVVGPYNALSREQAEAQMEQVSASTSVQIVRRGGHVPDEDVSSYFDLSDLVLMPYQKHVGMSGVLLKAAAHGKPVLCQDYGQIGEIARRHGLGVTIDTTRPEAIAEALTLFVNEGFQAFSAEHGMKAFAEAHDERLFAPKLLSMLPYSKSN